MNALVPVCITTPDWGSALVLSCVGVLPTMTTFAPNWVFFIKCVASQFFVYSAANPCDRGDMFRFGG